MKILILKSYKEALINWFKMSNTNIYKPKRKMNKIITKIEVKV